MGSQNGAPGSPLSRRQANRAVRIIHRWRLEHDPDAPPPTAATGGVAPAVKPITYYIDPSVPERWRSAVKAGVEAWAPAFEQAGFSQAIRAVLPGDDDWPEDYAAADVRHALGRAGQRDTHTRAHSPPISRPSTLLQVR